VHEVRSLLTADELARVLDELARGEWIDGRDTAGPLARRVKRNEQLRIEGSDATPAQRLVLQALSRHDGFRSVALPHAILPPMFSRCGVDMGYGRHVDNGVIGATARLRSDVSVTVFLSDPDAYAGGELVVLTPAGEAEFKLPAGDAVAYPSTAEHWVEPVRRGERLAAVTWVQSLVRDAAKRELLHDLNVVLARMLTSAPDALETALLFKSYANLLRRWADA
jgi:PKHD-type hydroxylase